MISRRHFLQGSGGGLVSLAGLAAMGQSATGLGQSAIGNSGFAMGKKQKLSADAHFFLFVQVYGAWDVCLAFDPKNRELKLPNGDVAFDQPYQIGDVKEYQNGIRLAPAGAPLGRWSDKLALVNGIDMEVDNGHIVDNMMAGLASPRNANLPWVQSIIAKRHKYVKSCAVPHLYTSYDGQFFGGPFADSSITATAGDFLAFLGPASGSGQNDTLVDAATMVTEYQANLSSMQRAQAIGGYNTAMARALDVGTALRAGGFTPPSEVETPTNAANLLGQLFAAGIVGSATLSFGQRYFFDTHAAHYAQHPLGKAIADVDLMCEALSKLRLDDNTSVLDRTTVVMTGEFCRTPRLNSFAGKDHNTQSNSFAAIGYKVRPGQFGASGARLNGTLWNSHAGLPVDFATGMPSDTGAILHPRNLWAGFGAVAGVDLSHEFGTDTTPVTFLG